MAKESKHRTRLSLHNEELQWTLKHNSERHQTTLKELSKSFQDKSIFERSEEEAEERQRCSSEDVTVSPPASPKIKGLVETSVAVSYILEMDDDESPVQVASRAIRRVGSFRASPANALKRSKSSSQSPMGNPLSQSASATSINRQFSAETSPMKSTGGGGGGNTSSSLRMRSKSMSVKPSVDRARRVPALAPPPPMMLDTSFHQMPIHSSSPYKYENGSGGGGGLVMMTEEKRRASTKNLSFGRSRAASFGGGVVGKPMATKEVLPQESAGEAMILHISDGEDVLSQSSSLTASTTSNSSSSSADEEAVKVMSSHQQQEQEQQEMVYTSLHSVSKTKNSRSGINLISHGEQREEEGRDVVERLQKWSPTRLMGEVAMEEADEEEEDDEDDVFGMNSESVV